MSSTHTNSAERLRKAHSSCNDRSAFSELPKRKKERESENGTAITKKLHIDLENANEGNLVTGSATLLPETKRNIAVTETLNEALTNNISENQESMNLQKQGENDSQLSVKDISRKIRDVELKIAENRRILTEVQKEELELQLKMEKMRRDAGPLLEEEENILNEQEQVTAKLKKLQQELDAVKKRSLGEKLKVRKCQAETLRLKLDLIYSDDKTELQEQIATAEGSVRLHIQKLTMELKPKFIDLRASVKATEAILKDIRLRQTPISEALNVSLHLPYAELQKNFMEKTAKEKEILEILQVLKLNKDKLQKEKKAAEQKLARKKEDESQSKQLALATVASSRRNPLASLIESYRASGIYVVPSPVSRNSVFFLDAPQNLSSNMAVSQMIRLPSAVERRLVSWSQQKCVICKRSAVLNCCICLFCHLWVNHAA